MRGGGVSTAGMAPPHSLNVIEATLARILAAPVAPPAPYRGHGDPVLDGRRTTPRRVKAGNSIVS